MTEQNKEIAARTLNSQGRLRLKEHDCNQYSVKVEAGTTIEDVQKPEFWSHFATKFRVDDEITVKTDDGVFYARLLVLAVGRNSLVTHLLQYVPLITKEVEEAAKSSRFEIVFAGKAKHRILRKSDGAVVAEGIGLKIEAIAKMAELEKA